MMITECLRKELEVMGASSLPVFYSRKAPFFCKANMVLPHTGK
ncbi:hypothetical protein QVO32_02825 [Bacteroides gallinaceum]|nr:MULTISPECIES: hypothetical protein [Bacteroides]MDN0078346.1 hypothetical protein [Bacteroides gallinaceum]